MTFDELLAEYGQPVERQRGQHLFHQGDADKAIYLVRSGLLKAYYLSDDGKEHIKSFLLPGAMIGSLKGMMGDGGCSFSLVCLEPAELICIDYDILFAHSRNNINLANSMVDFLLSFAMKKETREFEFLCLTAEERYQLLLKETPELFDRVTQNDIARYLGVTPVGLSRIKKRVERAA